MSEPLNERIAVLEEQMITANEKLDLLDDIHRELTKYKGFIGGILFVVSAIWTLLLFAKDWIKIKVGA
jgi:hypothetical protein